MEQVSYVVVFPSVFSKGRISQLVSNIKKILDRQNQQFKSVRRDGDVILVDANDPVFASSAINMLFGIEKITIARRVNNDFKGIVSEIATVGGNLLLKGEKFLVRVDGFASGFLPKDAELAATSEIIEKKSNLGARPGTDHNFDKLLYCHLTKNNAYVCIFSDDGLDGVPFRSDRHDAICCIYDELSAVSCYETMKQGFNPKIIVCYRKKSELTGIAKMINRIIPRLLKENVSMDVFHMYSAGRTSYQWLVSMALEVSLYGAMFHGIRHVSVPVSYMSFTTEFVDRVMHRIFECKKMPLLPISGLGSGMFSDVRELGLNRYVSRIIKQYSLRYDDSVNVTAGELDKTLESRQEISIKVGPNNVHDFLDSLENLENH